MAEDLNNYLMEDEETSGFDYKTFLVKLLMYWPWIVGCVAVFLIGAFFYLKTLTPLYTVSSSVLIKDDKGQSSGNEASLSDLGFITSSTQSFDNELEILRSRTLLKKVVTALDLYIDYRVPGQFRDIELYKQSPVKVWVTPEEAEQMGYAKVEMHFQMANCIQLPSYTMEKNGKKTLLSFLLYSLLPSVYLLSLPPILSGSHYSRYLN